MIARVVLPELEGAGRLGRHVEHDERSREFAVSARANGFISVLHRHYGVVLDQGDVGSCTGNALVGCLKTAPLYKEGQRFGEPKALQVYKLATRLDGFAGVYPPDDTGSSGLAACKAAKQLKLITSYQHAFGITAALTALQHGPVMTGVEWFESFDHPDVHGFVKLGGQVRGGHEFAVVGYDAVTHTVRCLNSWGPRWADHGYFSMSVATWTTLLERQGDVTVPIV
jgi:hypothetical protein